jgi:2-dehydropantoate 2-reductase
LEGFGNDMRIAVLGCGAVGGVMAACLTRAGLDVTPIVGNQRIEQALIADGFRFADLSGSEEIIPPHRRPVKTPAEAEGSFDLVIVATPSTALEQAIGDVKPFLTAAARIVTCQNGLPEERAVAIVGERVIGCVVGWGATMEQPGRYRRTSRGHLQIGRATPRCPSPTDVQEVLGNISAVDVVENLAAVRWSKLAINCVTSALGAIGGAPLGELLRYAVNRRLALEVFAEVLAVARAEGVEPRPVAGTLNITSVAITSRERAARAFSPSLLLKHLLLIAVGLKFRRMRSSMLYALERGRPIEIDFLNGEIVRRGARHGVPTPVNAGIIEVVRCIERRELSSSPSLLREVGARLSGLASQ